MLIIKGDPRGYKEKYDLDREVNCLEPYLEALPSLCVLGYIKRSNPEFLNTGFLYRYRTAGTKSISLFFRSFFQTCFTMALFLKSGPCFILPRSGFSGIIRIYCTFLTKSLGCCNKDGDRLTLQGIWA